MFSHCYDNHPPRDLHFHLWSVLKRGTKTWEQGMKHSAPNFILRPTYYITALYFTALRSRIFSTRVLHMTASHTKAQYYIKALHTNILARSILKSYSESQKEQCYRNIVGPRGLPLSAHFRDVMALWLSGRSLPWISPQCGLSRSAYWGHMAATKDTVTRYSDKRDILQSRGQCWG